MNEEPITVTNPIEEQNKRIHKLQAQLDALKKKDGKPAKHIQRQLNELIGEPVKQWPPRKISEPETLEGQDISDIPTAFDLAVAEIKKEKMMKNDS